MRSFVKKKKKKQYPFAYGRRVEMSVLRIMNSEIYYKSSVKKI